MKRFKTKITEFDPVIASVLTEMCKRVNVDSATFVFDNDWYLRHTWTEAEEKDFIKWLKDQLKVASFARGLTDNRYGSGMLARDRQQYAEGFVWNYGWKISKD